MNKKKTIPIICLAATLLCLTNCKPSLKKESTAVKQTISDLTTISRDSIPAIKRLIQEASSTLDTYHKKAMEISKSNSYSLPIDDMFNNYLAITKIYTDNIERYDKYLNGVQRKVFRNTMTSGVMNSTNHMLILDTITTKEYSDLSDQERLKVISDIKAKMNREFQGMSDVEEYFRKRIYNTTEAILGTKEYLY